MEELASPPEQAKANKEVVKRFRATAAEVQKMEAKAARAGLNFSEYCRRAALGKTIVERVPADLRRHIGAASSNLNQLTLLANAGKLNGAGMEALNALVTHLLQTLR